MLLYKSTSLTAGNIIDEVAALVKDTGNDIWSASEKLYSLKQAIRKLFPDIFVPKSDQSSLSTDNTYEYIIPSSFDIILAVKIRADDSSPFEDVGYDVEPRESTNYLILREKYDSGLTMKIFGGVRPTVPTSTSVELDIPQEAEDLLILGTQIELYQTLLLDKAKLNQFAAREQEVTELDVTNMIREMRREYTRRLGEVNAILLMQVNRI